MHEAWEGEFVRVVSPETGLNGSNRCCGGRHLERSHLRASAAGPFVSALLESFYLLGIHMKLSRLALAIALAPSTLLAAPAKDTPTELPPTVITRATSLPQASPSSVRVITREDIENSISNNLLDVLRGQGGLQIRDTMGDGSRVAISIRGFGENAGNNTLVLVDGRRLNQPSQQTPDLNSIPLSNIERIEIIRGAGTVLYGDQAVGGVINIITRTPSKSEGYVETSRGSHGLEAYRGNVFQELGGGFSAYLSGESRNTDNYRKHNRSNYDTHFGRLRYDYEQGHVLYEYQHTDEDLKFPGGLRMADYHTDRRQSVNKSWNDSITSVHRLAAAHQLNETWGLNFDYSSSDQNGKGDWFYNQGTRINSFNPRINGQFNNALGAASWLLGYDHITSDYELLFNGGGTKIRQSQRDWYTLFNQNLTPDLTLSLGYRSSQVKDTDRVDQEKHHKREGSSSVGLDWQISGNTRAFVKREDVLRWANVDDNGLTLPSVPFLKPQTGVSWESGIEWQDDDLRLQATLYRLDLKNEIMLDKEAMPNSRWGANINLDKTRHQGLILEADKWVTNHIKVGGQYTYTNSKYRDGSFKGKEVPWVSKNTASTYMDWEIVQNLKAHLEAEYTGPRYYSSDNANSQGKLGSYTLYNAAISYEYRNLISKLRVNNLTGKRYNAFAVYNSSSGNYGIYPAAEELVQFSVGYRF